MVLYSEWSKKRLFVARSRHDKQHLQFFCDNETTQCLSSAVRGTCGIADTLRFGGLKCAGCCCPALCALRSIGALQGVMGSENKRLPKPRSEVDLQSGCGDSTSQHSLGLNWGASRRLTHFLSGMKLSANGLQATGTDSGAC